MQGWFLGVLCSFASSLMNNTGLVLQKVSILNEHERVNASQRPCWEQPLWWVGMVVFLVSQVPSALTHGTAWAWHGTQDTHAQVPNVIALKLASLTLIAPLGAVCLVVNIVNSHLWLHEHIHLRDLAATGLVVLGCVISVVVAPSSDRQYGFAEMYDFFIQVTCACGLTCAWITCTISRQCSVSVQRLAVFQQPVYRQSTRVYTHVYHMSIYMFYTRPS